VANNQAEAITEPKLLLVEGRDEINFFNSLIRHLRIQEIEVRSYEGKDRLRSALQTLIIAPGFDMLESIGIVRDADNDANAAFQSVCGSLSNAGLPVPGAPMLITSERPQTGVMIMPPGEPEGMLENLCLSAFQTDPAMPCVEQYFECLEAEMENLPSHVAKAHIHAFLASRERPDLRLGEAALRGYLPWDSPAFASVRQFVGQL
jgi:hypothetical protein